MALPRLTPALCEYSSLQDIPGTRPQFIGKQHQGYEISVLELGRLAANATKLAGDVLAVRLMRAFGAGWAE